MRVILFAPDIWDDIFVKEYGFNFTYSLKRPKLKFHRYKNFGSFGYLAAARWHKTMMNEKVAYYKELFA